MIQLDIQSAIVFPTDGHHMKSSWKKQKDYFQVVLSASRSHSPTPIILGKVSYGVKNLLVWMSCYGLNFQEI